MSQHTYSAHVQWLKPGNQILSVSSNGASDLYLMTLLSHGQKRFPDYDKKKK